MSKRKTDLTTAKPRPVHIQIMRRIAPIIVVAFVAFTIIGISVYQSNLNIRINQVHQTALEERANSVSLPIETAVNDATGLADSPVVRSYALQLVGNLQQGKDAPPANQTDMIQLMLNTLNQNQSLFFEALFATTDGTVWLDLSNQNGVIVTSTDAQPARLLGDTPFTNTQVGTNNGLTVTPIIINPFSVLSASTSTGAPQVMIRILQTVADPVDRTKALGVIELDISAKPILDAVNNTFGEGSQRWILVNNQERFLADSASAAVTSRGLTQNFYVSVDTKEPQLAALLKDHSADLNLDSLDNNLLSSREIRIGNIADMPWQLVVIDSAGYDTQGFYTGVIAWIIINTLACIGAIWFISRILRQRLAPLTAATELAVQLSQGEIDETLPPSVPGQNDEVGQLITAFKHVSARLQSVSSDLEARLERHAHNLDVMSRISRESTNPADIASLLQRIVDQICEEFDLYHAQVFLLDDIGLNAVLAYSKGMIGERLLKQGLKIRVGSDTLVGVVASTGKPLVINDIHGHDATVTSYKPDPALPETRSQMTLPMMVGEQVIGVLDLYSNLSNTFQATETRLFSMLADELASAIHNARLLESSEQRLQQVDTLNRQLTRNAWEDFQQTTGLESAYRYNLVDVQAQADNYVLPEEDAIEAISAPITIRGEVIGTIAASSPEGTSFVQGDLAILRAVADRVGLAIEGARLFQETQTSLFVTASLYELSRYLNEANSLEDVVQAIINSVMPEASGGQIWLFDEYPAGTTPEWLSIAADWSIEARPSKSANFLKVRPHFPDSVLLSSMESDQIKIVSDVDRDARLDKALKSTFRHLGARSVVFVPFSVRGTWRGILSIEFDEPREFTESEGRIFSALIDQSGVAIDNRLLIHQTEMALDQIERLYTASQIINGAQGAPELVSAALAASTETGFDFEIWILEGQLDKRGWPTQSRKVAYSSKGKVHETNHIEALALSENSPLYGQEPEIVVKPGETAPFRAIFPLFSANQPIALLYMTSTTIHELSQDDYDTYHAITGQMSTILENRRLFEQTEQALDETRRLYTASRAIAAAQDSNAVYSAATEYLSQPVSALNRISILLGGPDPGLDAAYFDYVYVWERVADPESPITSGLRVNAEAAPFGNLMAEVGELVYFRDIDQQLSEQNRLRIALQRAHAASAVIIPLRTQRNWFGVLICESPWKDTFEEQYRRFAQAVADQVSIAIENRLLFEEAQLEAQRALALAEVGQLATRVGSEFERNISEVFARVAGPAAYDRWLLMLINDDEPNQLVKVAVNLPTVNEDADYVLDLDVDQHSIVDAVRQDHLLIINDPASYPSFQNGRSDIATNIGKHVVTPIYVSGDIAGALLIGRGLDHADLDSRDEQLVRVLAAQVAVAVENRRLFHAVENEREYLRSILETMPTGIMVLDARTFKPLQVNARAETLLGKATDYNLPFNIETYNLLRTGTNVLYPEDELPVFTVPVIGGQAFSDDLAVVHEDGSQTDLLLNAAPIHDARGNITAIVAAFQDIGNLRGLENALQNNLSETIALYEATRALSEAVEMDEVLDATITQLYMLDPSDGYLVLLDETTGDLNPVRGIISTEQFNLPVEAFDTSSVLIRDIDTDRGLDAETLELLREQGIAALSITPLRARDVLLGWIAVTYDHPREFSPEDERFLTTLSDGAATAIDSRLLFQSTEIAFQEAATLYETSRVLSNATTPNDIVQAVVNQMRQPHVTQVFMAIPTSMASGEMKAMQVVANWQSDETAGINLLGVTLDSDQFPAWRQVASPEIVLIDDATSDSRLTELEQLGMMSIDTRSAAILPLRAGNRRIGVIWMGSQTPYRHSERDLRIFRSFVEQASLSLEATRLLQQTERRARQLATSAEVSQIASSILDMNVLMPRIVDLIRDAFSYDHVQIFLMDEQHSFAELKASTGDAGKQLLGIQHKLAKGSASVIGTVTSTGQPAIALDTADARFVHKPNPYLPLTRSEMALPLIVKNRVVGALDVQSNEPNAFSDEDVGVLTTLANQISVALDNARLFEQSESRARDMSFLFTVTSAAANADMSLKESLQNVANLVRNAFDTLNVSLYLTETYLTEDGASHTILRAAALSGSEQPLSEIAEVYLGDESNLLASIAKQLEPVIVEDIDTESKYLPITSSARSAVAVPLASGNQMVGVIAMEDIEAKGVRSRYSQPAACLEQHPDRHHPECTATGTSAAF